MAPSSARPRSRAEPDPRRPVAAVGEAFPASVREPSPAWQAFADALLEREALLVRLGQGVPPRDFAGLCVDDDELDRLLTTLPGLDGPSAERVDRLSATLDPVVDRQRLALRRSLHDPRPSEVRFAQLVAAAGGDAVDAEVLALVAAVEVAPRRQRLVAYVQDSVQLPRVTIALLARLLPGVGVRAVAPGAAAVRAGLVVVDDDGPWAVRTVGVPARPLWALVGDESPDEELPPTARCLGPVALSPPASGLRLVVADDRATALGRVAAHWPGHGFLVTAATMTDREWSAVVREATVAGRVVVLEADAGLPPEAAARIASLRHLAWAVLSRRELPLESVPDVPFVEDAVEDGVADREDWLRLLGREPGDAPRLTRDQLALVARATAGGRGDLAAGVRRLASGHLDALAVRIRPRRGWQDLVLPPDHGAALREVVARHRGRRTVYDRWGFSPQPSTGTVALFSGPSGSGKTLAAEVVASELGLDLYKIDVSSVVSKYVGETEKNLEHVFCAAAAGDLVLFFDEADALFGKRSDVGDAHDRYANIEVAYLLQRLETYAGLVVLATNLRGNLDTAFARRIAVGVEFPEPDEAHRLQIWRRCFPASAPVADLDLPFLARQFRVTGGVIRNAALGAAFLAAECDGPIGTEHVVRALRREFQKLGRLRTASEFGPYLDLVEGRSGAEPAR